MPINVVPAHPDDEEDSRHPTVPTVYTYRGSRSRRSPNLQYRPDAPTLSSPFSLSRQRRQTAPPSFQHQQRPPYDDNQHPSLDYQPHAPPSTPPNAYRNPDDRRLYRERVSVIQVEPTFSEPQLRRESTASFFDPETGTSIPDPQGVDAIVERLKTSRKEGGRIYYKVPPRELGNFVELSGLYDGTDQCSGWYLPEEANTYFIDAADELWERWNHQG